MAAPQPDPLPRGGASSADTANAAFWDEMCGSHAASVLNLDLTTAEGRAGFDEYYFGYYPYLKGYLDRTAQPGDRVLEVGLGAGTVARYLTARAHSYVGLDIAPEVCRQVEATLPAGHDVRVLNRSVLQEAVEPGSFDSAIAIGSLHHTGDLAGAVRAVEQAVRPGGRLLIMVYNEFFWRRALRHPLRTALRGLANLGTSGAAWPEADERMRANNDVNLAGEAAPYTEYTSRRRFRRMTDGASYTVTRENTVGFKFGVYAETRKLEVDIVRERLLGRPSHWAGCDLYAEGTRG